MTGPDRGRPRWYALALLAAAGALLAKTSVVMLPVILLLLIWWRQGTITRRNLLRTVPFFLLTDTLTNAAGIFATALLVIGLKAIVR